MSAWELYLFIKLDAIIALATTLMTPCYIVGTLTLIAWLVLWVVPYGGEESTTKDIERLKIQCGNIRRPIFKILLCTFIVWLPLRLASTLLPTTKEMAIIYVVPKIINNEIVSNIPDKLLNLSSEWIEELRPKNVKQDIKAVMQKTDKDTAEAVKASDSVKKP